MSAREGDRWWEGEVTRVRRKVVGNGDDGASRLASIIGEEFLFLWSTRESAAKCENVNAAFSLKPCFEKVC